MLKKFRAWASHWRTSPSERASCTRGDACLGIEPLELRSLLSAAYLLAPDSEAPHFEDALYVDAEAVITAPPMPYDSFERGEMSAWRESSFAEYLLTYSPPPRRAALSAASSGASSRPLFASTPPEFVYIVTFTWRTPVGDSQRNVPPTVANDLLEVATQPKPSSGPRAVAAKALPESSASIARGPSSEVVEKTVESTQSGAAIAAHDPFVSALIEAPTTATRSSETSGAHDAFFQTLTTSTAIEQQKLDQQRLDEGDASGWARTQSRDASNENDVDEAVAGSVEFASLNTLRRVTDGQAEELGDVLRRLEQLAASGNRHSATGRPRHPLAQVDVESAAAASETAVSTQTAETAAESGELGGMVLLRTANRLASPRDVIDALDAALAIEDLDRFATGKLDEVFPVAAAVDAISRAPRAHEAASSDATGLSPKSETEAAEPSSFVPIAAAGMAAIVVAARGRRRFTRSATVISG